jgi:hypothetical protein
VQQFLLAAMLSWIITGILFCFWELSHYLDSQEVSPYCSHKPQCIHRQDAIQCGNIHYTK